MKEWFEGFIANGIQFRLDGSEITAFGVSYKIVIKNISNRVICTTGEVYFHFDNDVRKIQQISAQVRKSVDGPPGMLTEDHHHTVHEERQVCYSSHLRPKPLHL